MMKIKKSYEYLFYKLYQSFEKMSIPWWSEWKAIAIIEILIFFLILSGIVYYTTFVDRYFELGDSKAFVAIMLLIVNIPSYFLFLRNDRWKSIVSEFDQLPPKENKKRGYFVALFIVLVISNLIFSFVMMSQVNWENYR